MHYEKAHLLGTVTVRRTEGETTRAEMVKSVDGLLFLLDNAHDGEVKNGHKSGKQWLVAVLTGNLGRP